jgi:glycosyltransferase involved in cell wall biosynthesis
MVENNPDTSAVTAAEDRDVPPVKPLISIITPAYNEAAIIEKNLDTLCEYLKSLEERYRWEIVVVNDGSSDNTGALAEAFAKSRSNITVLHHVTNFGVGQALRFAFHQCKGDYLVTYDIDLTISPEHIGAAIEKLVNTNAKVVIASPFVKGGQMSNVPFWRKTLSVWANRFLALVARGNLSSLTCMVRAYDGQFARTLSLRSMGMEIMPEIIYKTMILRGRIVEIPAHMDWGRLREVPQRRSSMRMLHHTVETLESGFVFRPFLFFILPGLFVFLFSCYVNAWMFVHFLVQYQDLGQYTWFLDRASWAVAAAYQQSPHTFVIGLLSLMLAIQLISLGILSLQNKKYYEELLFLGTTIYKQGQAGKELDKG